MVVDGVLAAICAVTATLVSATVPAHAASVSATQQMTLTTGAGTLAVFSPPSLTLPNGVPGGTLNNVPLGSLQWQNTLNDATTSSVAVCATDLYDSATGMSIPFSYVSVEAGQSVSGIPGNVGTIPIPSPPGAMAFSGPDPIPGTTYSASATLATGSTTTEGTWTQSGNALSIQIPASARSGTYTATLQYTITG